MQDIGRQLSIAARWSPIIIVATVLAGVIAYAVASAQPAVYASSVSLNVEGGPNPSLSDLAVAQQLADSHVRHAETRSVANAVIDALGLDVDADELGELITVESDLGSSIIEIDARDEDPERAAALATAMADALLDRAAAEATATGTSVTDVYVDTIRAEIDRAQPRLDALLRLETPTRQEQAELAALENRLSALQTNFADLLPFTSAYERYRLVPFESASIPDSSVEPRPTFWAVLAAVATLIFVLAVAFVAEYLGGWVRSASDVEAVTGLPSLATIAERRGAKAEARMVTLQEPGSAAAGVYRNLVAQIDRTNGRSRTLVISGVAPSRGTPAVAANLAVAYAQVGRNVLIVDGDLAAPSLHEYFGLPNSIGVSNLTDAVSVAFAIQATSQPNLKLLAAGPAATESRSTRIGGEWAARLMPRLLGEAELVIVSGPPVPTYSIAPLLGTAAKSIVLVVDKGSRRSRVVEAAKSLDIGLDNLTGTVFRRRVRGRATIGPQSARDAVNRGAGTSDGPARSQANGADPVRRMPIDLPDQPGPYALPGADRSGATATGSGTAAGSTR